MKLDNIKIKDDITPELIAQAIEFVANSCFVNGGFNPYYQSFAERIAVVRFFLDGIEFEDGDSFYIIAELDDVKKLVNRFFGDPKYSDPAKIMAVVTKNAEQIIEYKKQRLIHGADSIEYIASAIGDFNIFINDLDLAINNIAKMNISSISKEDIEMCRDILSKLNASGIELNMETITKIIKGAVNFDSDKASQEIIDAKNTQIAELTQKTQSLEKKLAEIIAESAKKEDDGK